MSRQRSDGGPTERERGVDRSLHSTERHLTPEPRGVGAIAGPMRDTAMPRARDSSYSRAGSERGSATMDARSSVPASIQESCRAGNTVNRFTSLEANDSDSREDNAEIDAGFGTGRGGRGKFRGGRSM